MGIDWGRGLTNIDHDTGIRFGVLPLHDVCQAWCDSAEADYGPASCPKCGDEAQGVAGAEQDYAEANGDDAELTALNSWSCSDYGCAQCGVYFGSDEAFGDEARAFSYTDDGYKAFQSGDDCDIFIELSPFYTYAPFCSPCAPGACYLRDGAAEGDARAYCFGHDWFDGGIAPYPVYDVETGAEVYPAGLSF
jgi:hypothetical protein